VEAFEFVPFIIVAGLGVILVLSGIVEYKDIDSSHQIGEPNDGFADAENSSSRNGRAELSSKPVGSDTD
jgi:hypothetical protein